MKAYSRWYGQLFSYTVDDFFDAIPVRQKIFLRHELNPSKKKTKTKAHLDKKLHRKIIKNYLTIYFKELYSRNTGSLYFFVSGKIKLTQSFFKGQKRIYWLWYDRPSYWSCKNVVPRPDRAGRSLIRVIEKKFCSTFDISSLPEFYHEFRKMTEKKRNWINPNDRQ